MNQDSLQATPLELHRQQDHPHCFVCEPHRPFGLRVAFEVNADGSVIANVACPRLWQGYPGMVHGGIIASLLDGAMTHCLFAMDISAVTADLHVRYRHPLLLDHSALITAHVTRQMSPIYVLESQLTQQNVICCTATGKFMDRRYVQQKDTQ